MLLVLGLVQSRWGDVETLIDNRGDGLDFSSKFLLDLVKVEAIFVGDQVNGQTQVTETTTTADTMKVGLGVLWEIKVDDNVYGLDIDTTGQKIRADQVAADSVSEIVENAVTV